MAVAQRSQPGFRTNASPQAHASACILGAAWGSSPSELHGLVPPLVALPEECLCRDTLGILLDDPFQQADRIVRFSSYHQRFGQALLLDPGHELLGLGVPSGARQRQGELVTRCHLHKAMIE